MEKYELTEEKINWCGKTLHRIRACKDFVTASGLQIKAGDLGGYVENECNLSQYGNAWVCGDAKVCGNAKVYGNAKVCGDTWVCGNAKVYKTSHYLVIGPIGSRDDFTTFCRDESNQIAVKCGCFNGTIDDFVKKVNETHGDSKYAKVYLKAVELAKLQIDLEEDKENEQTQGLSN